MKQPKYEVGQAVFAIAFSNDSIDNAIQAAKVDEWSRDFARVYRTIISEITINSEGVFYLLKDIKSGEDWGEEVREEHVSDNVDDLFRYLMNRWKID